jgi:Lon protease-like protein
MSMIESNTLPLFPIPTVVLPGEVTALHLFEPRYLEMFADCEEVPNPEGDFVMVYSDGEHTDEVGCAVAITRVLNRNPDGSVDVLVEGRHRVRVDTRYQLHSYDSVRVALLRDATGDWDEALATRVYALHRQVLVLSKGDEPSDRFYESRESLAYAVAACSGFEAQAKRELLQLERENQRLMVVRHQLERILPLLQSALPVWKDILSSYSLAALPKEN